MMRARGAVLLVLLAGCRGASPAARVAPADGGAEALFRQLFEVALTERQPAALERAVAPVLVLHAGGRTATLSREMLWQAAQPILTAFPDVRFRVDDVVAQKERAAARVSFTATHRGPWQGISPTARAVNVTEMFFCRIRDGLLAECWQEWDEAGLRAQLTGPQS